MSSAFLRRGIVISKPIVQCSKYDLIADINHKLYKIQVKTGKIKNNTVLIKLNTTHTNTQRTINLCYTQDDVDLFATMYNGECYLIPFCCDNRAQISLRLAPPLNNQQAKIKYIQDYHIDKFLECLNQSKPQS